MNTSNDLSSKAEVSSFICSNRKLNMSNLGQMQLLQSMMEIGVPLRLMACGSSMVPIIRNKDILTIEPIRNNEFRIGEVIAISHPVNGKLAIHRIIAKKNNGWIVKGDNTSNNDGLVTVQKIIGKVVRVERNGKDIHFGFRPDLLSYFIARLSSKNLISRIVKMFSWLFKIRIITTRLKHSGVKKI